MVFGTLSSNPDLLKIATLYTSQIYALKLDESTKSGTIFLVWGLYNLIGVIFNSAAVPFCTLETGAQLLCSVH